MKVLFASATSELGGAEQVILALARQLPSYGIEVSFALLQPSPLEAVLRSEQIEVQTFPDRYRFRNVFSVLRCISWLKSVIRSEKADILHSNLTAHLVGSLAARWGGIPELWHLHDYPFHFDRVHALNRRLRASFYLFTTEYLKSGEPSLSGNPNGVVHPNCIDIERLRSAPDDPTVLKRLGIEPSSYFLTVARFQQHKGQHILIDAAARMANDHPQLKWVIAGRASGAEQEAYLQNVTLRIAQHGLQERVVLAGFVPDADMPALFRGAVSLVHPALTEGYGLVLLEAMAYGTPIIAAAASGPAEIIANEKNGLLVPTNDPAALAHAMTRLIDSPQLAEALRLQGSREVEAKSVDVMVARTIAIYRGMLKSD